MPSGPLPSGSDVTGIGIRQDAVNPAAKPALWSNRCRVTPEPVTSTPLVAGLWAHASRVWRFTGRPVGGPRDWTRDPQVKNSVMLTPGRRVRPAFGAALDAEVGSPRRIRR